MKPIRKQIEAAAKAIIANNDYPLPLRTAKALAEVALKAAAAEAVEVGEQQLDDEVIKALDDAETLEARTIERCAQVAEGCPTTSSPHRTTHEQIAAAIRALKDKP